MTWAWRTLSDGSVEVDRQDGTGFVRLGFGAELPFALARLKRSLTWQDKASFYGAKYGVPTAWILAIMTIESGGDPNAQNWCCAGLLAIFYTVHGKTLADMLDPDKNLDYGASILGKSVAKGYDFVKTAAVHNAGSLLPATCKTCVDGNTCPFGYCEEKGYIERAVKALNWMVDALGATAPATAPERSFSSPGKLAFSLGLGALGGFALVGLVTAAARRHAALGGAAAGSR